MQLLRRSRRSSAPTVSNQALSSIASAPPPNDETLISHTMPRSSVLPGVHPGMIRAMSEETLLGSTNEIYTDIDNYVSDSFASRLYRTTSSESNFTHISKAETVVDLVLGHSFSEFNDIRVLPVVSVLFQKGLFVYPSEESLHLFRSSNRNVDVNLRRKGLGVPLLQVISPMLSAFKRNSPILVMYKFRPTNETVLENAETPKFEFCKVYCSFLQDGSVKYTLSFTPNGVPQDESNFKVTMISSIKCSFVDCQYRNTRLRWLGATQMSSTYGSGFFKLIIINDESPSLLDGTNDSEELPPRSFTNNAAAVGRDLFSGVSSFPPVARFSDKNSSAFPKNRISKHGDIKLIEIAQVNQNRESIASVTESSLVMTCMSLVLRDQELRKNHGNPRCYDTSLSASVFY